MCDPTKIAPKNYFKSGINVGVPSPPQVDPPKPNQKDNHSCHLVIDGSNHQVPEDVYFYVRKLEKQLELLDTPFRKPNKDFYRFVKIIKEIGNVRVGVDGYEVTLVEGLWEKDGKEYIGYFSTTGLLPDFSEEINETVEEWMDDHCKHVDYIYKGIKKIDQRS